MKVLLIPLDERPCNWLFPQLIAKTNCSIDLVVPDKQLLSKKKKAADSKALQDFILQEVSDCDAAVISLDMLLYGGLIPSRLHHLDKQIVCQRMELLDRIKRSNPKLRVYAFQCIMRAPAYDSSEEEPDYYGQYGFSLFRRKYLLDYLEREGSLTSEEERELDTLNVPEEVLKDYEWRRNFNLEMNIKVFDYLQRGIIDFLVIPQDDSAPYGYTSISQRTVIAKLQELELDNKVMIYPGADEVSLSLLARAYIEKNELKVAVYPFYASVLGPTIIPLYEDRPMYESLKSHIRVCGAKIVETSSDANFVLAINCPGKVMQDHFGGSLKVDVTYTSFRNLGDFCCRIQEYLEQKKRVALCDSAFANGGDIACIRQLDRMGVLSKLSSYAGWNTNCNTLGTALSQAIIGTDDSVSVVVYRIIEDVLYQSMVRQNLSETLLQKLGLSYFELKDKQNEIERIIEYDLQDAYEELALSKVFPVKISNVYLPWDRMFELGFDLIPQ